MSGVDLSMMAQLKLCLANKEYVFTMLGNGCVILFLFLYLTIYGVMLHPYGFTDEAFIANCGVMTQALGITSGVIASIVLVRKPEWMGGTAFILPIACIIGLVIYDVAAFEKIDFLVYVGAAWIGFASAPIFTVAYEMAVH